LARVVSIHSFRGGTGKSNTTANLALLIARAGHRVGIIDTDIQSPGIHVLFSLDQQRLRHTLNDFLWGRCGIQDAAYDVTDASIGNVDGDEARRIFVVPSSINTGEIGRIVQEGYDVALLNDGIRELIRGLRLDYLLVDTHPGVNEETLLSIAICDVLLLVMRPDNQDFQGTAVTVELARKLEVGEMYILLNKVPPGLNEPALRERVEQAYHAEVAAVMPLSVEMARLASGGLFANRFPEHPFTRVLAKAAERIMSNPVRESAAAS
jgi:MinD-like ATPase involved in chromosome partitioning or flagellar assembly